MHDRVTSKRQLAAELGVTRRGLNRQIARGELPPTDVRVGRQAYWLDATLDAWFDRRRRDPRRPPARRDASPAPDGQT
jgi:predicted DNA-binding transcriptional regulator AlpA